MLNSKVITLVFTVLCITHFQYVNGTVQVSEGSQHFNEGSLVMDKKSFTNGNLVLAVCEKTKPDTMKCNLAQKVYPKKENSKPCTVTLKGDQDKSNLQTNVGVIPLGKNKAILYWGEVHEDTSTIKIGTVNLETCKMNEVKIPDPNKNLLVELHTTDKFVVYNDDSFDIFYNDAKRFGQKLGKITINADGTAKGQPIATTIRSGLVFDVDSIATRSPAKGYASLRKDDAEFSLLIIKPDGSEKQLDKYTSLPAYAAGENFVSACFKVKPDADITCKQFDENGNLKFTTTIPNKNKLTRPKAVQNLPGGGMLVMLAISENCDHESNCKDSDHRIVKIGPAGKAMGTTPAKEFDGVATKWKKSYVYKHGASEFCGVMVGANPTNGELKQPSDYVIHHHCVTGDEFKA